MDTSILTHMIIVSVTTALISSGLFWYIETSRSELFDMPDGSLYRGKLVNGQRTGHGESWEANSYYEGYWVNNVKQGYGKLSFDNSELGIEYLYEGEFSNNLAHGMGNLSYPKRFQAKDKNGGADVFIDGTMVMRGMFVQVELTNKVNLNYYANTLYVVFNEAQEELTNEYVLEEWMAVVRV